MRLKDGIEGEEGRLLLRVGQRREGELGRGQVGECGDGVKGVTIGREVERVGKGGRIEVGGLCRVDCFLRSFCILLQLLLEFGYGRTSQCGPIDEGREKRTETFFQSCDSNRIVRLDLRLRLPRRQIAVFAALSAVVAPGEDAVAADCRIEGEYRKRGKARNENDAPFLARQRAHDLSVTCTP